MNLHDFSQATEKYSSQLLTHARKFTNDEDDAKDLLQETLIKGIRFCNKFDEGTNLKGWLYVIMKNTFYNNCVKDKRKKEIIADEDFSSANLKATSTKNGEETTFALEDINKALLSIRTDHRLAFQRYFEGYKYDEISQELDIPLGTVKTFIHQARCELKKYLKMYK